METRALTELAYDGEIKKVRKALLKRRRRYYKCIKSTLKKKLIKQGKWTCRCGKKDCLELHHVVPLAMNGVNRMDNVIPLCHECHLKIHQEARV